MTNNLTGDGIEAPRAEWEFNADVAKSFNSHVGKSVPYYGETHKLAVEVSDWFVHDRCQVLDLGCSTGTLLNDLNKRHITKRLQLTGIDNSEPMLEEARKGLSGYGYSNIKLLNADLLKYEFPTKLSLIYSLYTLQFVDPQHRPELCDRIYQSLARRGAFVLIEKVLDKDSMATDIFTHIHWSKKEEMGFDVSEIYAKAQSLRGVLIPLTLEENVQMLQAAGFSRISVFWKWCNFVGIFAVK